MVYVLVHLMKLYLKKKPIHVGEGGHSYCLIKKKILRLVSYNCLPNMGDKLIQNLFFYI